MRPNQRNLITHTLDRGQEFPLVLPCGREILFEDVIAVARAMDCAKKDMGRRYIYHEQVIADRVASGWTLEKCAQRFGVTRQRILQIIARIMRGAEEYARWNAQV